MFSVPGKSIQSIRSVDFRMNPLSTLLCIDNIHLRLQSHIPLEVLKKQRCSSCSRTDEEIDEEPSLDDLEFPLDIEEDSEVE